jgi:serine phosphatase RsbU (regulator of sigma subunit)
MAQLRGLLRGIAYDSADGPAGVLARLDAAMEGLGLGTMATVLVGRLEQTEQERADGVTRLRWTSAGHLPPLIVGPAGELQVVTGGRAGLLLGVDPTAVRTEQVALIERGSTLLLYTDGLVERRDQAFDDGVELLGQALAQLRHRPVEEMCDELLARLLPERAEDDVALVAVRLRPQER